MSARDSFGPNLVLAYAPVERQGSADNAIPIMPGITARGSFAGTHSCTLLTLSERSFTVREHFQLWTNTP